MKKIHLLNQKGYLSIEMMISILFLMVLLSGLLLFLVSSGRTYAIKVDLDSMITKRLFISEFLTHWGVNATRIEKINNDLVYYFDEVGSDRVRDCFNDVLDENRGVRLSLVNNNLLCNGELWMNSINSFSSVLGYIDDNIEYIESSLDYNNVFIEIELIGNMMSNMTFYHHSTLRFRAL